MRTLAALLVSAVVCGSSALAEGQEDWEQSLPAAVANALGIAEFSVESVLAPAAAGQTLTLIVSLGGNETALVLDRHPVRSPKFQLLNETAQGQFVALEPPPAATYRGYAVPFGSPGGDTRVLASWHDGQLTALVRMSASERWIVQPLREIIAAAAPELHLVYRDDPSPEPYSSFAAPPLAATATGCKVVEVALDADYEFYQLNNSSVSNTLADIEAVMNGVSSVYESGVSVTFELTTVIVRTAEPDPYTFTLAGGLLNQLRGHWNTNHGDVVRDVCHLMTGKDLDGTVVGDSFYSVMCSQVSGYGLSQSRFSGNFNKRVAVTAHYLGRNFGASTCDGQPDCAIMCSTIGGCTGSLAFGSTATAKITATAANSQCLVSQPAPKTLPFNDSFATALIDATSWTHINGAVVNGDAVNPPSGPLALNLDATGAGDNADDEIRSNFIDLSPNASATLRFHSQHRGVESGEYLVVEYASDLYSWHEIGRVTSNGVDQTAFTSHEIQLPPAALNAEFRLRFRAQVNAADDDWYVDDVELLEIDHDPPQLSNLSLAPDPWELGNPLAVSVSAVDPQSGVKSVSATLKDGATPVSQITLANTGGTTYAGSFPASLSLAEKTYQVVVSAEDNQENSGQAAAPIVCFDLPVIAAPLLSPALPLDSNPLAISAEVTDATSAVATVTAEYLLNGGSFTLIALAYNCASGRYEGTFAPTGGPGSLVVTLRAADAPGNSALPETVSCTIYVTGGVPPVVSGVSPTPNPLEIGQPLAVSATVTDIDSPLQGVTARIVQSSAPVAQITLSLQSGSTYGGTFGATGGLANGPFTVEVAATDIQSNTTTGNAGADAYTAPSISSLAVSPATFAADDPFSVSAVVTHPVGVEWVIGGVSTGGSPFTEKPLAYDSGSGRYRGTFDALGHGGTMTYRIRAASTDGHEATPVTSTAAVSYLPVTLTSVDPASGSMGGGTTLVLQGSGFSVDVVPGSARVLVGGVDATGVSAVSDTEIHAVTPAAASAGQVAVEVRATKGASVLSASLPGAYTYGIAPAISQVSPASGSAFTANTLVIKGVGFSGDGSPGSAQVTTGGREPSAVTVLDDETLRVVLPASNAVGLVDSITVTTPFGVAVEAQAFQNLGTALNPAASSGLPAGGRPAALVVLSDLDGDGHPEVAVASPEDGAGKVLLRNGTDLGSYATIHNPTTGGSEFGRSLLAVPDLNGDGVADLIVGEPGAPAAAQAGAGRVHAISPKTGEVLWATAGPAALAGLGTALAGLGDLNGDGYHEVAAGLPGVGAGAVWILDGQSGAQIAALAGTDPGEQFGAALAAHEPADGSADRLLLVGAPRAAPAALTDAGRAYFHRVKPVTLDVSAAVVIDGDEAGGTNGPFGRSLGLAILVDPGGSELVAIGFPGADAGGPNAGKVRARAPGSAADLWSATGLLPGDGFGTALAAESDYDDDGGLDLVVGAPGEDGAAGQNLGAVHLLSGSTGMFLCAARGPAANSCSGRRLAAARDSGVDLLPDVYALTGTGCSGERVDRLSLDPASFTLAAMIGMKLSGKVPDPLDLDGLRFEVVAGEELTFTLKAAGKQKYPIEVALTDGAGVPLVCSDPASPFYDDLAVTRKGKNLTVTFTAAANLTLHLVIGRGGKPYKQSYSLATKRQGKGKVQVTETIPFANPTAPLSVQFHAPAGATLGGSVAVAPGGNTVTVTEIRSPSETDLANPKAFKTSKKGDKVTLKASKLALPETGTYQVLVQPGAGGTGDMTAKLTVNLPKSKKKLKDGD